MTGEQVLEVAQRTKAEVETAGSIDWLAARGVSSLDRWVTRDTVPHSLAAHPEDPELDRFRAAMIHGFLVGIACATPTMQVETTESQDLPAGPVIVGRDLLIGYLNRDSYLDLHRAVAAGIGTIRLEWRGENVAPTRVRVLP